MQHLIPALIFFGYSILLGYKSYQFFKQYPGLPWYYYAIPGIVVGTLILGMLYISATELLLYGGYNV